MEQSSRATRRVFIAGIPVKPAADGLDSSVDYSAYNNGSGAQSDGGVRQKKTILPRAISSQ